MAHRKDPKRVRAAKKGWKTRRHQSKKGLASGTSGYKKGHKKHAKKRARRH